MNRLPSRRPTPPSLPPPTPPLIPGSKLELATVHGENFLFFFCRSLGRGRKGRETFSRRFDGRGRRKKKNFLAALCREKSTAGVAVEKALWHEIHA